MYPCLRCRSTLLVRSASFRLVRRSMRFFRKFRITDFNNALRNRFRVPQTEVVAVEQYVTMDVIQEMNTAVAETMKDLMTECAEHAERHENVIERWLSLLGGRVMICRQWLSRLGGRLTLQRNWLAVSVAMRDCLTRTKTRSRNARYVANLPKKCFVWSAHMNNLLGKLLGKDLVDGLCLRPSKVHSFLSRLV